MKKKSVPAKKRSPLRWLLPVMAAAVLLGGIAAWLLLRQPEQIELPYLTAQGVVVLDARSGAVLYDKDGDTPRPISSITKLMSLFLVLDDIESGKLTWEDEYTATDIEAHALGSRYGIQAGEVYTVYQLVAGTALCSGCDCLQCLVRLCAGNEADFVSRMNEKAEKLGLKGSRFENPTGIDASGHYMTARDVAKLARSLVDSHPEILTFTSASAITNDGLLFRNTHRMVGVDPRVRGLKTGTTEMGGYSLVTWAEQDGKAYVIVLLDCASDNARFSETKTVMDVLFGEA